MGCQGRHIYSDTRLKNGYAGSDLGSMDRKLSHTFSRVNLRWSTGRGKVSTTVPRDFTRNPNGHRVHQAMRRVTGNSRHS